MIPIQTDKPSPVTGSKADYRQLTLEDLQGLCMEMVSVAPLLPPGPLLDAMFL